MNNDIRVGRGGKLEHSYAGPSVWPNEKRRGRCPPDKTLIPSWISWSSASKIHLWKPAASVVSVLAVLSTCSPSLPPLSSVVLAELIHWTPSPKYSSAFFCSSNSILQLIPVPSVFLSSLTLGRKPHKLDGLHCFLTSAQVQVNSPLQIMPIACWTSDEKSIRWVHKGLDSYMNPCIERGGVLALLLWEAGRTAKKTQIA